MLNDNLQQQIDTIYDYWFLQYKFPNFSANPYKSSCGNNEDAGAKVEKIPAGWKKVKLCQIEGNIITGKTPSTSDRSNYGNDIPFITIGDIRNNKYVVSTDISLSTKGADSQKNKFIPADSLCVTCIASPGIIGFSTEPSQTNQQINTIIFSNDINKEFLYCALRRYFTQQGVVKTGNTFANMNKDDFSKIPIVYPDLKTLEIFHRITMPLSAQMKTLSLQNKHLISLRNWLLPLLMSGQATIAD